jgi:hypothetical protein
MRFILYVPCIGWDLLVWFFVSILRLLTKGRLAWQAPPGGHDLPGLWAIIPTKSLLTKAIRYFKPFFGAMTLGHGGIIIEDATNGPKWSEVEDHESIHVEQFEVLCFMTTIFTAINIWKGADPMWSCGLWISTWLLFVICGTVAAVLRGEDSYRGAAHEEAAYSIQGRNKRDPHNHD